MNNRNHTDARMLRLASTCNCTICKQMCMSNPCFPTPEEVVILLQRGYQSQLALQFYKSPKGNVYPVIAGKFTQGIGCTFQNRQTGLCELHDPGLKPMEGRFAIHDLPDAGLRVTVAQKWLSPLGIEVIDNFCGETEGGQQAIEYIKGYLEFYPHLKSS